VKLLYALDGAEEPLEGGGEGRGLGRSGEDGGGCFYLVHASFVPVLLTCLVKDCGETLALENEPSVLDVVFVLLNLYVLWVSLDG
jgi:hypothetical protein